MDLVKPQGFRANDWYQSKWFFSNAQKLNAFLYFDFWAMLIR